eukprot:SAG22_NODE_4_length_44774_cov_362.122149_2_plen_200_part_00
MSRHRCRGCARAGGQGDHSQPTHCKGAGDLRRPRPQCIPGPCRSPPSPAPRLSSQPRSPHLRGTLPAAAPSPSVGRQNASARTLRLAASGTQSRSVICRPWHAAPCPSIAGKCRACSACMRTHDHAHDVDAARGAAYRLRSYWVGRNTGQKSDGGIFSAEPPSWFLDLWFSIECGPRFVLHCIGTRMAYNLLVLAWLTA